VLQILYKRGQSVSTVISRHHEKTELFSSNTVGVYNVQSENNMSNLLVNTGKNSAEKSTDHLD
jgi:hypothetical protein